jgi:hypothetical protein
MYTQAEQAQMLRETIADALIDRDDYFLMEDPNPFLDWAVANGSNYVDLDSEGYAAMDYNAMFDHWMEQSMDEAA